MIKYLKPLKLFQESLKRSSVLIGLNVRDKYVSLAISDESKYATFEHAFFRRDERILDNLVDRIQECISGGDDLEGIIIASKYPVDPSVNIHSLMDDLCKKGKFESLKYTCLKDDTTSWRADFEFNKYVDLDNAIERFDGVRGEGNLIDLLSAYHMLQASLDIFNNLVERKTYDEMEDSK